MQRTQPPVLTRLARVNPLAAFLLTLVLALVGLFAPGIVGGAVLLLLAVALGVLLVSTWPFRPAATRAVRLLVLTTLVTISLIKIL